MAMTKFAKVAAALFVGVVFLGFISGTVSDFNGQVTLDRVDTETEFNNAFTSSTNVNVTSDGYVLISDGQTSGSFTVGNYTNATDLLNDLDLNEGSAEVTVTGYDSGGSQVSSQTYQLDSDESVDFSGQAGEDFEITYDLSRTASGDASPSLDLYKVLGDGETMGENIAGYVVMALFGLMVALAAKRML